MPPTMDSSLFCLERRFPHPRPALDLELYPHFLHLMLWQRDLRGRCQKKKKHSLHFFAMHSLRVTLMISKVIRIFNSFHHCEKTHVQVASSMGEVFSRPAGLHTRFLCFRLRLHLHLALQPEVLNSCTPGSCKAFMVACNSSTFEPDNVKPQPNES